MNFFFSVQTWVQSPRIQLQGKFTYICRFQQVGINTEKFGKTRIRFNSVVFPTLAIDIFKAPYIFMNVTLSFWFNRKLLWSKEESIMIRWNNCIKFVIWASNFRFGSNQTPRFRAVPAGATLVSPTDNSTTLNFSSFCLLSMIISSVLSSLSLSLSIHTDVVITLIPSSIDLMPSDSFTLLLGLNKSHNGTETETPSLALVICEFHQS